MKSWQRPLTLPCELESWDKVTNALADLRNIRTLDELRNALDNLQQISSEKSQSDKGGIYSGLLYYLQYECSECELDLFINLTLTCIVDLVRTSQDIRQRRQSQTDNGASLTLSQEYLQSLLASALLCLLPQDGTSSLNFTSLYRQIPFSSLASSKLKTVLTYMEDISKHYSTGECSPNIQIQMKTMETCDLPSLSDWLMSTKPLCQVHINETVDKNKEEGPTRKTYTDAQTSFTVNDPPRNMRNQLDECKLRTFDRFEPNQKRPKEPDAIHARNTHLIYIDQNDNTCNQEMYKHPDLLVASSYQEELRAGDALCLTADNSTDPYIVGIATQPYTTSSQHQYSIESLLSELNTMYTALGSYSNTNVNNNVVGKCSQPEDTTSNMIGQNFDADYLIGQKEDGSECDSSTVQSEDFQSATETLSNAEAEPNEEDLVEFYQTTNQSYLVPTSQAQNLLTNQDLGTLEPNNLALKGQLQTNENLNQSANHDTHFLKVSNESPLDAKFTNDSCLDAEYGNVAAQMDEEEVAFIRMVKGFKPPVVSQTQSIDHPCRPEHLGEGEPSLEQLAWMTEFRRRSSNLSDLSSRRSSTKSSLSRTSSRCSSDFSSEFEEYYENFQNVTKKIHPPAITEEPQGTQNVSDFASEFVEGILTESACTAADMTPGVQNFAVFTQKKLSTIKRPKAQKIHRTGAQHFDENQAVVRSRKMSSGSDIYKNNSDSDESYRNNKVTDYQPCNSNQLHSHDLDFHNEQETAHQHRIAANFIDNMFNDTLLLMRNGAHLAADQADNCELQGAVGGEPDNNIDEKYSLVQYLPKYQIQNSEFQSNLEIQENLQILDFASNSADFILHQVYQQFTEDPNSVAPPCEEMYYHITPPIEQSDDHKIFLENVKSYVDCLVDAGFSEALCQFQPPGPQLQPIGFQPLPPEYNLQLTLTHSSPIGPQSKSLEPQPSSQSIDPNASRIEDYATLIVTQVIQSALEEIKSYLKHPHTNMSDDLKILLQQTTDYKCNNISETLSEQVIDSGIKLANYAELVSSDIMHDALLDIELRMSNPIHIIETSRSLTPDEQYFEEEFLRESPMPTLSVPSSGDTNLGKFAVDLARRASYEDTTRRASNSFQDSTLSAFADELVQSNPNLPSLSMFQQCLHVDLHPDTSDYLAKRGSFDSSQYMRSHHDQNNDSTKLSSSWCSLALKHEKSKGAGTLNSTGGITLHIPKFHINPRNIHHMTRLKVTPELETHCDDLVFDTLQTVIYDITHPSVPCAKTDHVSYDKDSTISAQMLLFADCIVQNAIQQALDIVSVSPSDLAEAGSDLEEYFDCIAYPDTVTSYSTMLSRNIIDGAYLDVKARISGNHLQCPRSVSVHLMGDSQLCAIIQWISASYCDISTLCLNTCDNEFLSQMHTEGPGRPQLWCCQRH
ncbi:unnamed protein product [Owenia fusiformis]|uniref:PARG helical domain-containing protein n=1 Tax=Owenia fusiformis TaxID=6347 RepID=A0A8S4NM35_OWEFU|nr:unnamed protein product [Owenia fusiformis]